MAPADRKIPRPLRPAQIQLLPEKQERNVEHGVPERTSQYKTEGIEPVRQSGLCCRKKTAKHAKHAKDERSYNSRGVERMVTLSKTAAPEVLSAEVTPKPM